MIIFYKKLFFHGGKEKGGNYIDSFILCSKAWFLFVSVESFFHIDQEKIVSK
jgi:hypothetical protein